MKVRICVRVSDQYKDHLEEVAKSRNMSLSDMIMDAIDTYCRDVLPTPEEEISYCRRHDSELATILS
jgi:hypothetical protein